MTDLSERLASALADRYRIERELGAGGMATVYLAHDAKHDRAVALKVLQSEIAAMLGRERFLREIRLAAKLNHPHVLPLLDSGEADGALFYTMPLVEGESLRARIDRAGQLGLSDVTELARDVGAALDYAHKQGVIHRDIKPENILFHHDEAMVADFGVAFAVTESGGKRLTATGLSVGTPLYMSPEQVSGDDTIDARSDVYSLGCVLYEALAGEPPFTGRTAMHVMARQVTDPVRPITTVRPDVPRSVAAAVTKALAKVPGDRFRSAGELAAALAADEAPPVASSPSSPEERPAIAILPFANLGQDPENEYFADGMWEDVIANLSGIDGLRVISRTSSSRFKDTTQSMKEVSDALGASMIMEGSVRRSANRVRVVVQLIDAKTDTQRWAETYDRELTDVFAIQSEVALSVASALQAALTSGERERLGQRPTDDLAAYDLYLLGRHNLNKRTDESIRQAIGHFESALALDSRFVRAHAGLSEAYLFAGMGYAAMPPKDALPRAKAAAARAIELDPSSAEAHGTLGFATLMGDWDLDAGTADLQRAIELNPDRPEPHQWLGWCLSAHGQLAAAIESWERALELDPLSAVVITENGWPYSYAGLHEQALEWYRRAIEIDPAFALAHYNAGWALQRLGRFDEAIVAYERAVELSGSSPFMRAFLATAYAESGRTEEAQRILDDLLARSTHAYGMGLSIALAAESLGELDLALGWLDRAFEERDPFLVTLGLDDAWMVFASLRDHPRFRALVERIGVGVSLASYNRARARQRELILLRQGAAISKRSGATGVAVLPFENVGADTALEFFSDGITEDIITQLSKIHDLKVISRASSMRYKNSPASPRETAHALGVKQLVHGSVRHAGNRVRITARLTDVSTDRELWAESYDRNMSDVFAIQSDVAQRVATALRAELTPAERKRLDRRPTADMEAYREYLLGRHHWARWTEESFKQSIAHFERAVERDPAFAEAHSAMSEAWSHLGVGYWSVRPLEAYPRARDAAVRAVDLDPDSAEANARLAMVEWWFEFAFHQALERLERATALNPNCAPAFDYRANILTMLGRHDEALTLGERACELDPASIFINANHALFLYRARRWSDAVAQFQRVIDLDPNLPMGHGLQALSYVESGDLSRALEALRQADRLSFGHHAYRVMLGYGHAAAGDHDQAREIIREIEQLRSEQNVWLVMLAMGYLKLGDPERALDLLEDAHRERGGWIVWLAVEPGLDALRAEPRFAMLLNRMGLAHD
jgi:serine/threonine-protein kinase